MTEDQTTARSMRDRRASQEAVTRWVQGVRAALEAQDTRSGLYRSGETLVLGAYRYIPELGTVLAAREVRALLLAPLTFEQTLVGMLSLGAHERAAFTAEHADTALQVARSLAIAIRQAQLVEEQQRHVAQIEASLHDKEVLLREVHHRVKNNLQIISSLISLQSAQTADGAIELDASRGTSVTIRFREPLYAHRI